MRVPANFMENEPKAEVFIKTYVEHKESKIYTKVEENLLVIVLRGAKKLIYQDFETVISEGESAIFHKGNYIMNQIINEGEYESLLIFMSDNFLNMIGTSQHSKDLPAVPFFQGKILPHMQPEVEKIYEFEKSGQYQEIMQLKIVELLLYMQKEDPTGAFKSFLNTFSEEQDFKNHIFRTYSRYENISEMAEAMNMSVSTLKRKFQKDFGCSPHLWMNERKLEKAIMLLDTSDYSITDIGFICGFSSLSTFMGQFKKKYGMSPGKYRKS